MKPTTSRGDSMTTKTLPVLNAKQTKMVGDFQCPGCACGSSPDDCEAFTPHLDEYGFQCAGHVFGTIGSGIGRIALGLPIGFCRIIISDNFGPGSAFKIVLHESSATFKSDQFNVPVWALERDGFLFLRVFKPRVDQTSIHVIKGGVASMYPRAIDVTEFVDEMD